MHGFFERACIKWSQHVFAFAETDTGADTVIIKARALTWFFHSNPCILIKAIWMNFGY